MGYILLQVKIDKHKLCLFVCFPKRRGRFKNYITVLFTCNLVEGKGKDNPNSVLGIENTSKQE